MSGQRSKLRVVVDGSNLATEGRSDPSLVQLDEVLRAFQAENPHAELIVVADATFAHRVTPGERGRFQEREIEGTIVTPPAGAIGRGDAFILKIADRIGGVVLSNDSFQEFHHLYPWLFDEGRLIGGKPVPGVGWIFTPRLPVRGAKSVRATKKAALAATSVAPTAPAVTPPVAPTKRTARGRRAASAELAVAPPAAPAVTPPVAPTKRTARGRRAASAELAVAPPAAPAVTPPVAPTKRT
ncbi:MAG: NYN domain-containing protein, partial [Acidimicrobiales bacterium]